MLGTMNESAVRMTTRMENPLAVGNRDVALEKVAKTVEERPVETPRENAATDSEKEEKTGGYNLDEGKLVYERYDKSGKVIFRAPPEQKPIDERA